MNSATTLLDSIATDAREDIRTEAIDITVAMVDALPEIVVGLLRVRLRRVIEAAVELTIGGDVERRLPLVSRVAAALELVGGEFLEIFDPRALSADVRPDVREFYESARDINAVIDTVAARLAMEWDQRDARDGRYSLDSHSTELRAGLVEFERVSGAVGTAAKAWGDEALRGPMLKAECMAELMTGDNAMARSSAEKAVTSHPVYASHKETLDTLVRGKYDAETAADVARVRVNVLLELAALARVAALTGA